MDDLAITCSLDRRSARCRIVYAAMCANRIQDRMAATRIEIRTDASEINGRPNECLANAVAVGCEVIRKTAGVDKANRAMCAAIVIEFGDNDFAICHVLAVLPDFLVLHVEVIALANIKDEVDVPGKDAGDVHYDPVRQTGIGAAFEERGIDNAVGEAFAFFNWSFDDFRNESVLAALDPDGAGKRQC